MSKFLKSFISTLCISWACILLCWTALILHQRKFSIDQKLNLHSVSQSFCLSLSMYVIFYIFFCYFQCYFLWVLSLWLWMRTVWSLNIIIGLYSSTQRTRFIYFFEIQYRFLWHVVSKQNRMTNSQGMDNMPVFLTNHYTTPTFCLLILFWSFRNNKSQDLWQLLLQNSLKNKHHGTYTELSEK